MTFSKLQKILRRQKRGRPFKFAWGRVLVKIMGVQKMQPGLKNLVIGAFILGSFSVQAGKFARYTPKRSDSDLLKRPLPHRMIENANLSQVRRQAMLVIQGNIEQAQDPHLETLEGKTVFVMYDQFVQISKSDEWNENGAAKNAIQFLGRFVEYSETLPVSKAFDKVLVDLGYTHQGRLAETRQNILDLIETGRLFEFFENKESETIPVVLDSLKMSSEMDGGSKVRVW